MKALISLFIILLTIISLKVYSQTDTTKKCVYIIKTDLFLPIIGIFNDIHCATMTIETGFRHRNSVQLTAMYADHEYNTYDNPAYVYYNEKSIVIIPEYKYYFGRKKSFAGLYIGGFLSFTNLRHSDESEMFPLDYTANNLGSGVIIGYQNYFRHFVFDFLLGAGYMKNYYLNITKSGIGLVNDLVETNSGFIYRIAVNVGYKF